MNDTPLLGPKSPGAATFPPPRNRLAATQFYRFRSVHGLWSGTTSRLPGCCFCTQRARASVRHNGWRVSLPRFGGHPESHGSAVGVSHGEEAEAACVLG